MNLTSNADVKIFSKIPNLINVADSDGNLVLILNMWIIFFEFLYFTSTNMIKVVILDPRRFFHELSDSINTLFVECLVVKLGRLTNSLPI